MAFQSPLSVCAANVPPRAHRRWQDFDSEGISEHLQRPLYSVRLTADRQGCCDADLADLGTTVEKLEAQLPLIFQRAYKWKSVLLLDEADEFLEQRSLDDVHRNALVSVFLRELEYYQGIMFLTTNRVKQIDDAIASRIHLPLKSMNRWARLLRGASGRAF